MTAATLPKNADWEAHGKRQRGFDRGDLEGARSRATARFAIGGWRCRRSCAVQEPRPGGCSSRSRARRAANRRRPDRRYLRRSQRSSCRLIRRLTGGPAVPAIHTSHTNHQRPLPSDPGYHSGGQQQVNSNAARLNASTRPSVPVVSIRSSRHPERARNLAPIPANESQGNGPIAEPAGAASSSTWRPRARASPSPPAPGQAKNSCLGRLTPRRGFIEAST